MTTADELKALMVSTWPEIGAQAYSSFAAARDNFQVAVQKGEVDLPAAFLQIGQNNPDPEFGAEALYERAVVTFGYVVAKGAGGQATLDAKLRALRDAVEADAGTTFQAIERGAIDTSETNPIMAQFLIADFSPNAGILTYSPGLRVAVDPS